MEPEDETHSLSSYELLHLAENHLRLRNYSLSSQYALESLHSTANASDLRNRAQQIVAVSDVLSAAASQTLGSPFDNWYSVLGVDTFCSDIDLIRSKFKSLLFLLAPVRSTFPPAEEAMSSAWKAWIVLGNHDKKSELDSQLYAVLARGADESESFWTVCPYCYYTYEYARVFEGYCLRCQNASCRRVFQGLPTPTPPPVASIQDGSFSTLGHFPLGFSDARNGTKLATWSPFVGMFGLPGERTTPKRKALDDDTGFVEISDDSQDSDAPVHNRDEQTRYGIPGNGNIQVPGAGSLVANGAHVIGKMLMERGRIFQMNKSENLSDAMGNGGVDIQGNFDQYECNFEADMQFVEKDGEIFLEMPPGDED